VGGALPEAELVEVVDLVGLVDGRITERFDCYAGTSSMERLASDVDVHGVNLFARKPE
jgi:arsenite methyltransferase